MKRILEIKLTPKQAEKVKNYLNENKVFGTFTVMGELMNKYTGCDRICLTYFSPESTQKVKAVCREVLKYEEKQEKSI